MQNGVEFGRRVIQQDFIVVEEHDKIYAQYRTT